ncbi:helix-turn-helix transcriptional regulator [Actinocrinis puniceicyclus]|uniref:Helix-turn-helix transcriptional regulator n=1 Tax=Actinocrinis puniceicyclus TaxID=977794 RepID=A0A8J7WQM0_9ACTN|nr:helix-turn-helix transcriptional regulator [Actinocrinis puniceicyclus]MBS2964187.1 helix-turn-helix transcriptional regulator [Actinocrinis puniceicyclus]
MRYVKAHIEGDGFAISVVTCSDEHAGWSPAEPGAGRRIVLVRSGRFRLRTMGREGVVDPTTGYLQLPGAQQRFAHPAGGDVCTSIGVSDRWWRSLAGDGGRPSRPWLHVDGRLELAHRRLARAIAGGDTGFAVPEQLLDVLALSAPVFGSGAAQRRAQVPSHAARALADGAREAVAAGHPAADRLTTLAGLLEVSPYHLSRVFRRETGTSLTRYRNRARVSRALERIEAGERDLAGLAADLGFADQAHFIRTVREHTGHTPGRLRELLAAAIAGGS